MTSIQQREQLQSQIWKIANEVRGAVDGWDFKQFVLGTLFYRFISENFTDYIEGDDDSIDYASLPDSVITPEIKDDAVKTKGYFIYPSQLFVNVVKNANTNPNLNTDLKAIFDSIESSANGYASEKNIKGLFADFDTTSTRLGNTVENKNSRLAAVLKGVEGLSFGSFEEHEIDLFGDAYEFLINNYAANAGKSGGEFFTPQNVSKLISRLAMHGQTSINKIYDPAAGSGSLLLQAKRQFEDRVIEDGFYGQEINHTTYNLARMNMFLHNINYDKFNIALGNTLIDPQFGDDKPFDAIVSNPPYSINWDGSDNPVLINDDRFAPAGVLAPKSKADFAFVLHALNYLSSRGRAAIVCFPGIFYRGGAEQKIRKYLVDSNFIETVIALPPNLFYGTSIAVNILVLSKHKLNDTTIQFIDASGDVFFTKETNNNVLEDKHIDRIIEIFDKKEDIDYIAKSVDYKIIIRNNYNLSVSNYIEVEDTRPKTDIKELNERIRRIVVRENELRTEIDKIVTEIEVYSIDKIEQILQEFGLNEVEWKRLGDEFVRKKGTPITATLMKQIASDNGNVRIFAGGKTVIDAKLEDIPNANIINVPAVLVQSRGVIDVVYYDKPFTFKNEMWAYSHANNTTLKYLYYYLKKEINKLREKATAMGAFPQIAIRDTEEMLIPIPPFSIQEEIVRMLDNFTKFTPLLQDSLRDSLQARQEQYEYYRNKLLSFPKITEA